MNTDDLIEALSSKRTRHSRFTPGLTLALSSVLALLIVLVLSLVWLKPRTDLAAGLAVHNYVFLLKLIFVASVIAGALAIIRDLSVPGRPVGWASILTITPFAVIIILALRELSYLPVGQWSHHVGHTSWVECLWQIPVLSIPAFVVITIAVRHLAPTNLARTGAYMGLFAGGVGAIGYALHCHNDAVVFVAISYTVAILEMTLIGAIVGPRILQWK